LLDPVREVWVFSDEPETAIREILEANPSLTNIRSIIPPPNVADVESIVAMATGAAIVISNSTFSWWAAMSSGSSLVFAPKKWFRGKPDPAYLYPDTWLLHEATWVE
jgi:hypothetical protein